MSFDEHHLRIENSRLREEVSLQPCSFTTHLLHQSSVARTDTDRKLLPCQIDRISAIAAKYVGKSATSLPMLSPPLSARSSLDLGTGIDNMFGGEGEILKSISSYMDIEKPMLVELAVAAMEELVRMSQLGEPLWAVGIDGFTETLNEEEYARIFPRGIGPKSPGMKSEATRATAAVIMNHVNLVEMLMDVVRAVLSCCLSFDDSYALAQMCFSLLFFFQALPCLTDVLLILSICVVHEQNQWSNIFSDIVSRAITLEVLSTGVAGNFDGALQLVRYS